MSGSNEESPPVAEDGRWASAAVHGEERKRRTAEPKLCGETWARHAPALEARSRQLSIQQKREEEGKEVIGVTKMCELERRAVHEWQMVKSDRREAAAERRRVKGLNCFIPERAVASAGELCAAWRAEEGGWTRVEVVMDSGAAVCVCPKSMAPHIAVEDTAASKSGVYYTSADGGKIMNAGQQTIPIAFKNGVKAVAVFQVAAVSRPLMSVAKICELGNRVLFGAGGGVILNLQSGEVTPFEKKDGVYVFSMWIPPLSEVNPKVAEASFARRP